MGLGKGFLIDVDGTLCLGEKVIEGTPEYVESLRSRGVPFLIASNNSSMSSEQYLQKLLRLGFDVTSKDVLTATRVTVEFLRRYHPGKRVFALGMEGFIEELTEGGVNLVQDSPDIVLLAYDKTLTFDKLNKAAHFIQRGARFIATHPDITCNSEDGYDVDIGSMIALLQAATGVTPEIIAKPEGTMADMSSDLIGVPKEDIYVVGDRLYTDIAFAKKNGMIAVLVLTGEAQVEDIDGYPYKPDYIINSIMDLDQFMS